jgi:glycosyltransferase involved in cell wall biosynthesis
MSTRVLFLYSALQVGGAERQLALLVLGLRDRGFTPIVATLRARGRFYDELAGAGVECHFVGMRSRWDLRGALRGYRLWKLRPDLVVTVSVDAQVIGQAIAERSRVPHVTVEHGGPGIYRGRHREFLARLVARRVDRVVVVSPSQVPDLHRLSFRPDAIRIVPNGSAPIAAGRSRAETRSELELESDDVVATLVAGLRPEKRPDVFVDAVLRANARNPRIRGLVVGGGRLLADVQKQAEGGGGAVLVLGERADVADLMNASDAVCFSSDVEALPVAVLEAMALAKPVVSTDVGGIRDAVVPGETGWRVPRQDTEAFAAALLEVARDAREAEQRGERGRERYVAQFTVDAMIDRYAELFARAAARDGDGAA